MLGVAFGMSSRLGALLRAFPAPALPDRCPIAARSPLWTPKLCFRSPGSVAGQLFALPFASPQVSIGTHIHASDGVRA